MQKKEEKAMKTLFVSAGIGKKPYKIQYYLEYEKLKQTF
jgi:hypothetical protein